MARKEGAEVNPLGGAIDAFSGGMASMFAGGAGIVGDTFGAGLQHWLGRQSAEDARNFMQYNSDTAYRRAVADLNAAGLNPMLAYMRGGASSPSSGMPSAPDMSKLGSSAVSSAEKVAQVRQINSLTHKANVEAELTKAMIPKAIADTNVSVTTAQHLLALMDKLGWETRSEMFRSRSHEAQSVKDNLSLPMWDPGREGGGMAELQWQEQKQKVLEIMARVRGTTAEAVLSELKGPGARNMADSDQTWWGRNVRPYLNDAAKVGFSASQFADLVMQMSRSGLAFERNRNPFSHFPKYPVEPRLPRRYR